MMHGSTAAFRMNWVRRDSCLPSLWPPLRLPSADYPGRSSLGVRGIITCNLWIGGRFRRLSGILHLVVQAGAFDRIVDVDLPVAPPRLVVHALARSGELGADVIGGKVGQVLAIDHERP